MRGQCTRCGAIDYCQRLHGKIVCEDCYNRSGSVGVDHEMMRVHMDTEAIAEIQAEGGARRIDGILADLHEKLREDNPNILPANYLDELGQKWQKEEYKEDGQVEFYRKGDM